MGHVAEVTCVVTPQTFVLSAGDESRDSHDKNNRSALLKLHGVAAPLNNNWMQKMLLFCILKSTAAIVVGFVVSLDLAVVAIHQDLGTFYCN